jgi:hypothetical protein
MVHFTKLSGLFKLNEININITVNNPFKMLKEAMAWPISRSSAEWSVNNIIEHGKLVFLSDFKSGVSRT